MAQDLVEGFEGFLANVCRAWVPPADLVREIAGEDLEHVGTAKLRSRPENAVFGIIIWHRRSAGFSG
jgi:hypothetical protein